VADRRLVGGAVVYHDSVLSRFGARGGFTILASLSVMLGD
jgi:hypothetical protein